MLFIGLVTLFHTYKGCMCNIIFICIIIIINPIYALLSNASQHV